MLAAHGSLSLTKKRNDHAIHLQAVHADRSCNNIHNRIYCPHLMKMYLILRYIVRFRFCFRQNPENMFCQFFRRIRHLTPVNDRENISQSAMFVMMVMVLLFMPSSILRMYRFRLFRIMTMLLCMYMIMVMVMVMVMMMLMVMCMAVSVKIRHIMIVILMLCIQFYQKIPGVDPGFFYLF